MENLKDLRDLMGGEVLAKQRVNGLESGWAYLGLSENVGYIPTSSRCVSHSALGFR